MEQVFEFLRLKENERKELRSKLVGITPTMLAHIGRYSAINYLEQLKIPKILAAGIAVTSLYFESRSNPEILDIMENQQSSIPNKVPTNETAASTQIENKTSKSSVGNQNSFSGNSKLKKDSIYTLPITSTSIFNLSVD